MRQKFQRFMYGRNGADQLARLTGIVALVLMLLSALFREGLADLFFVLALAALIYTYFRVFSKNLAARREENAGFLRLRRELTEKYRLRKDMWSQRKEYKFFKCSSCGAMLRVPKGKGRIRIVCRKCGASFERKT